MIGRDRDKTETLSSPAETRPRPDVYSNKQVNVGLTTVATVTACPLVSWCILDFCVFNSSDYVQTIFMPLQSVLVDEKMNFITPWSLLLKVIMLHKY